MELKKDGVRPSREESSLAFLQKKAFSRKMDITVAMRNTMLTLQIQTQAEQARDIWPNTHNP